VPPKNQIVAVFRARGHLIDSGLMSDALEAVQAAGAVYNVQRLDIGKHRTDESELDLEVISPNKKVYERVRADLMSLGLSEANAEDAVLTAVDLAGTAPEGFYSTTNLATEVRVGGTWFPVEKQRMDAVVVVGNGTARCVKLRDLQPGDQVVTGFAGIQVTAFTTRKLQESKFAFMQSGVSSERRLAAQVETVVAAWKQVRTDLPKVTSPLLMFRSAEDHVVDPSSGQIILTSVSSRDLTERILEHSFHVATLDNDAPMIFEESAEFVRRVTGP